MMTALLSTESCFTIEFLASLPVSRTHGHKLFLCHMYDGVTCLSPLVLCHKEAYRETAVFIFPRQMVSMCTSLFQAACSPFFGTKPFFSHSSWFLCLWSYTSQIHIMSRPIPWRLTQHYFSNCYWTKTSQSEIHRASHNLNVTTIFTTFCLVTFRKENPLRLSKNCRLNSKPTAEGSSYPGIWVYATFTHVLYRKSDGELFSVSLLAHAKIFNY